MKKLFLVLICFLMLFAVACSKSKKSPCDGVTCSGHGTCDDSSGRASCECDEGYFPDGQLGCDLIDDPCKDVECEDWQLCTHGDCVADKDKGFCDSNADCQGVKICDPETHKCVGPCDIADCSGHGECREGTSYGSGYNSGYSDGYGSGYQSGGPRCYCEDDGFVPEECGSDGDDDDTDTDGDIDCTLSCGVGACVKEDGDETCTCPEPYTFDGSTCILPCQNLDCGEHGECKNDGSRETCLCNEGYFNLNNEETAECVECNTDDDCESGKVCDLSNKTCSNACQNVNCGNGGVCSVKNSQAVCNCPHGYVDNALSCVEITSQHPGWVGVQWPFTITKMLGEDGDMVYGRIYVEGITGCPLSSHPQQNGWKAQLGYKRGTGSAEYPVISGSWTWVDANFNSGYDCADGNQNHEYMIPFPTDKGGDFIYIFRFSLDNGKSWWYGDKGVGPDNSDVPGPAFITSADNHPGKASIEVPPSTVCELKSYERTADSYTFTLTYHGSAAIDFAASVITLNGVKTSDYEYDETTKTFTVSQSGLEPNKYSWLFRFVDENGESVEPCFVPLWVGDGVDYAGFGWRDAFIYQIMTDRFLNGDTSNDVPASEFSHVTQDLEKWKGGDFRGIIKKIEDGYFTKMGVNALWISSPILNPHHESQGGTSSSQNEVYFTSYHAYHPLATGYSFDNDYGYDNEGVDPAFGTADELRELVEKAHKKGIRVIPDFAANHVYVEAALYQQHKNDGWFYPYNPCDGHWDDHRIDCWFTPYMPDFNYNNAEARKTVIEHAVWLIQNFNLDGFRADALKHMDDIFTIDLRTAIKNKIETTVENHDMPDEAEVFYMVGESLGGWARYHTRATMVQGQVNEDFYYKARDIILHGGSYNSLAHDVTEAWDKAYLTPQSTNGGTGGFPGAVMGNFFGNHDQNRALTECNGDYTRLKHAQTFLLTSPINIPMLYQGDDIGMTGANENGFDGGRRAVMKFTGLSSSEQDALQHIQKLGTFRKSHPALRHGSRSTCGSTDNAWVYKLKYNGKTVIVGINKGSSAYTTTCSGESGTFTSYDGNNVTVSNGSVTVPANGSLVIGN